MLRRNPPVESSRVREPESSKQFFTTTNESVMVAGFAVNGVDVRRSVGHIASTVGAVIVIAVIIWIDVTTALWQELVILAGLAAGLISFLLTALWIDRIIERGNRRRWAPVSRLALTEILHDLADEENSDLSRGSVAPRLLWLSVDADNPDQIRTAIQDLRAKLVRERRHLARTLGVWSPFLASVGGVETLMSHVADTALHLDAVRDASLDVDSALQDDGGAGGAVAESLAELNSAIEAGNCSISGIVSEIEGLLREYDAIGAPR